PCNTLKVALYGVDHTVVVIEDHQINIAQSTVREPAEERRLRGFRLAVANHTLPRSPRRRPRRSAGLRLSLRIFSGFPSTMTNAKRLSLSARRFHSDTTGSSALHNPETVREACPAKLLR